MELHFPEGIEAARGHIAASNAAEPSWFDRLSSAQNASTPELRSARLADGMETGDEECV
jgi:hypothetical protein